MTDRLNRVAMMCHLFPPIGGGGTPRSVKFVKHLPSFGYRPFVVTVLPDARSFSREFQPDESPSNELKGVTFDLVRIPNPARRDGAKTIWQSRWFPWIWAGAYPWYYDDARPWAYAAAKRLVTDAHRMPVSLVYATAGPNATLIAAAEAASKLRVPWVADLRDLWNVDSLKSYPSSLHYRWLARLERRTLRTAAAVIANTPLAAQRLKEALGADRSDSVHVITNGFDPTEFNGGPRPIQAKQDHITLVHAGTLYNSTIETSRIGRFRPYDLDNSARSVKPIVDGLKALRVRSPSLADRFRIRLLGYVPDQSKAYIVDSGMSHQIVCEGVRPRDEAISAMRDASALLIVQVAFADPDKPVPYVPGKVYEYLATGAPILAPIPPGDLFALLKQAPQAYISDYRDSQQVANSLERLASDLDAGRVRCCDANWLSRFDRFNLAGQLASIFDKILGHREANAS